MAARRWGGLFIPAVTAPPPTAVPALPLQPRQCHPIRRGREWQRQPGRVLVAYASPVLYFSPANATIDHHDSSNVATQPE